MHEGEKGREKRALSFPWEAKDRFCGLSLLGMKIKQGVERRRWPSWHNHHCCASEKAPLTKIPVLGLVLLWPLERQFPSLGMPTSFRTSRNPSACPPLSGHPEIPPVKQTQAMPRERQEITASQPSAGCCFGSQRFILVSSFHRVSTDLSITCLGAYHNTLEPRSPGFAQELQPKAKMPRTSLRWQRAELAFLTEVTGISYLPVRTMWAQSPVSEEGS